MEPKLSEFGLREFLIQESHIIRYPNDKKSTPEIVIKPAGVIKNDFFELTLDISIVEENRLDIQVIAIGIFQFTDKVSAENIPNYFVMNAPAIIFPYIRAYIATLTSLSGHDTVTIPVMNLSGIQNELKANIEVLSE